MHYSRQVNLQRGKNIVSVLKAPGVRGIIGSDSRKQSIKNVVLLLIFSQISCGQLHSEVFSGERCLVAHTLFIGEKSVMSPSLEGDRWRLNGCVPLVPLWWETLNVSWWDLWGLNTLCALAAAWAAFVFPIKRLKQWMIAVGHCGRVQYKYKRCVSPCVCVCYYSKKLSSYYSWYSPPS